MTVLTLTPRTSSLQQSFVKRKIIHAFIAQHLGVDLESVCDESHIRDDLGLDYLDMIELTILVEQQFADGRALDETDDIEFVGDLIRHIEKAESRRSPRLSEAKCDR